MTILKHDDVTWITKYNMDPVGKLFIWNGRIFRKIYNKSKKYVLDIIKSDMFKELVNMHLFVNTWVSDSITFGDDDLILESEYINCKVSYTNYTIEHVLSVVNMVLDLNYILIQHGYILRDPHFANILFDGSVPVYVDLGSIAPMNTEGLNSWYTFLDNYYYPLYLMHVHGKHLFNTCNYIILRNDFFGNNFQDCIYLSHGNVFGNIVIKIENLKRTINNSIYYGIYLQTNSLFKNIIKRFIRFVLKISRINIENYLNKNISVMKKKISKMKFNFKTQWGDYQNGYANGVSERFLRISKIIESLQVSTCLELAANQGVFSTFLLDNNVVKEALCTDYDRIALGKGFSIASKNNSINKKITFSVLNIFAMVSGDIAKNCEPVKCDIVVALAVTHHLLLSQKIDVTALMEFFMHCTKKYIIVEFMPLGLWNGETAPELPEWYTLDWFLDNLKKYFNILKIEQTEINRIAILGELIK